TATSELSTATSELPTSTAELSTAKFELMTDFNKKGSSLRGGTTKQSFTLIILAIKIASSAEKASSQ
ncbi:hypothetical protein, partial [Pedobacter sp. AJM]|uniref:hypothetical protein n=1 Tax=Pedobacter sp. AJM TaxID=2003629 RepID=UPI001C0EA968